MYSTINEPHTAPRCRICCAFSLGFFLTWMTLGAAETRPDPLWRGGAGEPAPPPPASQEPSSTLPPPPTGKPTDFDPRPTPSAERVPGRLHGRIENFGLVKRIWAVDRSLTQAFLQNTVKTIEIEGVLDVQTKSYAFASLPEGRYDLKLELTDGRIVEGCDLRPAGTSLDPLTYDDRQKIRATFANVRHFADQAILWKIEGNGSHATAIVELTRIEKTSLADKVDGDDFVVWRVELWQFQKHGEAWQHQGSQVLRRIRPSNKSFEEWNIEFTPNLGAIVVAAKQFKTFDLTAPQVSDLACGRYSRNYQRDHRQAGPTLHAGITCKVMLIDPETGTVVLDAGAGRFVTKGMEVWLYGADGKTVLAKGPVLRVSDTQTTAQIPGLKARLPEVDPDDPYDGQGEAKLPEALQGLKIGSQARLVPLPE